MCQNLYLLYVLSAIFPSMVTGGSFFLLLLKSAITTILTIWWGFPLPYSTFLGASIWAVVSLLMTLLYTTRLHLELSYSLHLSYDALWHLGPNHGRSEGREVWTAWGKKSTSVTPWSALKLDCLLPVVFLFSSKYQFLQSTTVHCTSFLSMDWVRSVARNSIKAVNSPPGASLEN